MIEIVSDIILISTGFLLIVVPLTLLTQKTKNKLTRNLLAAFLLTKATILIRWGIFRYGILPYDYHYIYYVWMAVFLALAPMLYIYIKSICYKNFTLHFTDLVHFITAALIALLLALNIHAQLAAPLEEYNTIAQFFIIHDLDLFWV